MQPTIEVLHVNVFVEILGEQSTHRAHVVDRHAQQAPDLCIGQQRQ